MITLILFSAAMGWCGTPYPWWWWRKPPPPPPPDWFQNYFKSDPMPGIIAGIIGGIAAGLIMKTTVGADQLATIGLAALAGGRIVSDVLNGVRNAMK